MQTFDIVKQSEIKHTYRVARIMGDFDVKEAHSSEHFTGQLDIPDEWNIGVIVGASGTGKTTIAEELYHGQIFRGGNDQYKSASVIDDMPQWCSVDDIEKMFYAVGFGSVPSWLKPYNVLSNGEKMRVDIARALLEKDFAVFDEYTSVVDRNVAQVTSIAVAKAIRKSGKKFIAVTCHRDVLEWLQPDWVFDTDIMSMSFAQAHARKNDSESEGVGEKNGRSLGVIII